MELDISRLVYSSVLKSAFLVEAPITDLDVVQNGHDKHVQSGVSPADNNSGAIGSANVRRPEDAHQAIMLYHDQQEPARRFRGWIRKSRGVSAALAPRFRYQGLEGAEEHFVCQ